MNKLPNQIVENGCLSIPLYHGTSTIWFESIRSHGLGGQNVVNTLNVKSAYSTLLHLGQKLVKERTAIWESHKLKAEQLLSDKSEGWNFRHGSVYLTPCWYTASRYAQSNEYGSEVISGFFELYNFLIQINKAAVLQAFSMHSELLRILEWKGEPIILGSAKISIDKLDSENADGCESVINELKSLLEECSSDSVDDDRTLNLFLAMAQQCNFRLLEPIPFSNLEIFRESPYG